MAQAATRLWEDADGSFLEILWDDLLMVATGYRSAIGATAPRAGAAKLDIDSAPLVAPVVAKGETALASFAKPLVVESFTGGLSGKAACLRFVGLGDYGGVA